jgi:RNA polymerase sigma-70 factor (ECF subfamily)
MTGDDMNGSSALDEQWQTLAVALSRSVRRQCPQWLASDADDIAQAALAKVMRSEKVGEGQPPLSAFYLRRVAHSALVDEIRRRRRRREVALESPGDGDARVTVIEPATQGTPETVAALRELGEHVRECLKGMKRERRLAVMLHLQGHSVPEVARTLGWILKRADNLVYRGLADLRHCLTVKGHRS